MKTRRWLVSAWISILVAGAAGWLSAQQSPDDYFGRKIGADRVLVDYPDIVAYFRYLAQHSRRIRVTGEGMSTRGNPLILACLSSEENIRRLPELMEIGRKLANPDGQSEAGNQELLSQARLFILVTGTIHSTEIASSQAMLLEAHRLCTSSDPALAQLLNEVVLLFMPSINPDGHRMVCEWYTKNLGTPYEGGRMPWLYHPYAGHDNNRDFYMLNLPESRAVNAVLHQRYFPQIFLDMHQMGSAGPRMFVPPFANPMNFNLSPVMIRECELIGSYMALQLQRQGLRGVANGYGFDAYWPGGSKNTAWYKNVVGLLTEMASCKVATPVEIDFNELRAGSKGLTEYLPQVNFPDPWPGGRWGLPEIITYERAALQALLEAGARHRLLFLENFLRMGQEQVAHGKNGEPGAYLIPVEQWDGPRLYDFLGRMLEHGVRIHRLAEDITVDHRLFLAGTFMIRMDQPYRPFIQVMMEKQFYPEIPSSPGGPLLEPYDATGWTFPLLMGVRAFPANLPADGIRLEAVRTLEQPVPPVAGTGDHYTWSGRSNEAFLLLNRLVKKGISVWRASAPGQGLEAGDFMTGAGLPEKDLAGLTAGSGLAVTRRQIGAESGRILLQPPRLAMYQSYLAPADEGWTRYVLDRAECPYVVLHNEDFRDKAFLSKFDTIIFPDQSRSAIVEGKSTEGEGARSSLPDAYQGGIGKEGLDVLRELLRRGGNIILLGASYELAEKDFGLPVRNVLKDVPSQSFDCPGSILQVEVDTADPLGWGLENPSILYFDGGPAFRTSPPRFANEDRAVAARFAGRDTHLLSGYLKGGQLLNRAVAVARFRQEKGRVVVLGGKVQYRAQSMATFKFLFNAIWLQP